MRILTRYILREVLAHAAIGTALFTFVIFMRDVGHILELVVRNSAPLPSVAEIFFLTLPTAFTVTIPMGVLVGILIGLSRMAADSEVTAVRASGIGSWHFVRVISIFALGGWLLALFNSLYIAPRSAAALTNLQNSLKNAQVSYEVQPRVFYEDFKNYVLYVQDAQPAEGTALWKNLFLADITNPAAPKITIARQALVTSEENATLRLHLKNGSQQETAPQTPEQYQVTSFDRTDIPIQLPVVDNKPNPDLVPVAEIKTTELLFRARNSDLFKSRWYWIEFHRRLALASACLVLALVGIPLGMSSKKGGKSTGFVLTIALVFLYYFTSLAGVALARQGKLPPGLGVWSANMLFFLAGLSLLRRVDRSSIDIVHLRAVWKSLKERFVGHHRQRVEAALERRATRRSTFAYRWPQILDNYVLRQFVGYLVMVLATFLVLSLVFSFFELLSDIIRNRVPLVTVGEYLLNVIPSMVYLTAPLSVLVAVLVTFGLMQKSNELTAMKATGISIYRAIIPVLVIAVLISGALFVFDQFYLPYANKRQDALHNSIKGKPPQTYLHPRKWIFGEHNTIYYYAFFDPDRNQFANLTVFEFAPGSFEITKRIYATRVRWEQDLNKWVFEQGWTRRFRGDAIEDFSTFEVATFEELNESPQYFKKEIKQSSEMNFTELRNYINDLEQSGFDVVRLRVQLQKKIAFPLISFVMALLAVPFSLAAGKRGALTGVAVAITMAAAYWVVSGLFEAMGNVNQLPAILAAWSPDFIFGLFGGYLILKAPT